MASTDQKNKTYKSIKDSLSIKEGPSVWDKIKEAGNELLGDKEDSLAKSITKSISKLKTDKDRG